MATTILVKRGTAAAWTASNRILLAGEEGFETDTKKRKIGDGVTGWNTLPYEDDSTPWIEISGTPTTLAGYGITDAASDAELVAGLLLKADTADLALKADNSAVAAGLALKADITSLLGKADVIRVPPANIAADNTVAVQSYLDSTGEVSLVSTSPALLNNQLTIKSNTRLKNARFKLAPNTNKNMLRNEAWGDTGKVITSITNTTQNIGGTLAVMAVVVCAAHGKQVGDYVFINGCNPRDYNGIHKIHEVVSVDSYKYILAYDVGDAIASATARQEPYIAISDTYTTNSVTATSGNAAVTGTGFKTGAEWVGKSIGTVISGVFTILGIVQSVASAAALTLAAGSAGTVAGGKWTIMDPAEMRMYNADYNITLDGCYFDYDGLNQSAPDTFLKHAIYLRRVKRLTITNLDVRNVTKYGLCLANCYDVTINGVVLDTNSDGMHFQGSGANLTVENVSGKTGDDFVVLGHSDLFQYLDPATAIGDFENVTIRNLKPRMALSPFKYYGCAGASLMDINLTDVGGKISGGPCGINFLNDSFCVGSECGGNGGVSFTKRATVNFNMDHASGKPALAINGSTIENLLIPEMVVGLGNVVGLSNGVLMNNGSRVNNLVGGNWQFYSSSGAFAANAAGWYMDGTSMVLRASVANIGAANIGRILNNNCTVPTVENTCIWDFGVVACETVDYGCVTAGRITLNYSDVRKRGQSGSAQFWIFNDFSILRVGLASNLSGSNAIIVAAGKNLQIFAPNVGVDTTVLAGTIVGQRDSSFFNVAAALGTLNQFCQVAWRVIDSKWVQLTNNSLTS
jgi:hypothetical protein